MDDNNNDRRIVVLDDGETWSDAGYVAEVTDEAYKQICDGRKVKNMLDVTVSFVGETVTGVVKELKVELDKDSTTAAPVVKDFKIDITGVTTAADVKSGTVT